MCLLSAALEKAYDVGLPSVGELTWITWVKQYPPSTLWGDILRI